MDPMPMRFTRKLVPRIRAVPGRKINALMARHTHHARPTPRDTRLPRSVPQEATIHILPLLRHPAHIITIEG